MELLRDIPHTEIADMRVFLLGGIAPSVMKRLREEQQKQDAEWFDGFVEWTTEGDRVLSAVAHFSDRRMCKIKFRNARIWKEIEKEFGTINLFAEVLWEDGKLRLNILTHTNEFSVLAEDVELEWAEEDYECMRKRQRGEIE